MKKLFQKGNKLGQGRPKGSPNKDRINYLDLQMWAKLIMDGSKEMTGKELVEIGFRGLSLLLTKIQNLPSTPVESLANAIRAQEEALNSLEAKPAIIVDVPQEKQNDNANS